jgi:glutamate-1-semialdehyde 2,1-aminomutase
MTPFFTAGEVTGWDSASKSDTRLFAAFFQKILKEGIYWPPSQFEAAFVSLAHSEEDIDATIDAFFRALKAV